MPFNMEHLVDTHAACIFHAAVCGVYSQHMGHNSALHACGLGFKYPYIEGLSISKHSV